MSGAPTRLKDSGPASAALQAIAAETLTPARLERIGEGVQARLGSAPAGSFAPLAVAAIALVGGAVAALVWSGREAAPAPAVVVDVPFTPDVAPVVDAPAPVRAPAPARPAPRPLAPEAVADPAPAANPAPAVDPTPRPSTLAEQIAALKRADEAARRGAHDEALGILDALTAAHPDGALTPEIDFARWEALRRLERSAEARSLATTLSRDPRHVGRRAQLQRWLVEEALGRGDCSAAGAVAAEAAHTGGAVDAALTARVAACTPAATR
jgi:hypothetical protein